MLYRSLLLLSSLVAFSSQTPTPKRSFSNGPVIGSNFPDPAFIQVGNTWYAFGTANGRANIPVATSNDFNTWTLTNTDALPNIPSWSNGNTWAPDVSQLDDGSFVMYFAAGSLQDTSKHCVGAATSNNIMGPYHAQGSPLACPLSQGGAIDAAGFRDGEGSRWVVYKIDGNSLGGGGTCGNGDYSHATPIYLQQVGVNGLDLINGPQQILDRDNGDGPLIEAPSLSFRNGVYFLFFSSNCYNGPYYDTSYATSVNGIHGPYQKASAPLLVSGGDGGRLNSPGGASVNRNTDRIVFHSDLNPSDPGTRQMWTGYLGVNGRTVTI